MRTFKWIDRTIGLTAAALLALQIAGCVEPRPGPEPEAASVVERFAPGLDRVMATDVSVDTLAEGFSWSEGPVWVPALNGLLFSDVPEDRIHLWTAAGGERVWLDHAGYTGTEPRQGENGPNGLLLDSDGHLVVCQHGDRRVARLVSPLDNPAPEFETVVALYDGARFNSPNDAVYRSDGSLWFTDPPYGLDGGDHSEQKEVPFNGVYALFPDGRLVVVTDTLTRPNGIAFSPDERTLYVANSDAPKAYWAAYDIAGDGTVGEGRVLLDVTGHVGPDEPGVPDGFRVDRTGVLFGSGPGGIWIIDPDGTALGRIRMGDPAANVAFGEDGRSLFITASSRLLKTRVLVGR